MPVVNSLSDFEHPCQALADLLTIRERRGSLAGGILTYVGDGNNVAHSLLLAGAKAAMHVRVATPAGFAPIPQVVDRAREIAAETGGSDRDRRTIPSRRPRGADVLYTDVWASMGQEEEATERALVFQPFQLDERLIDAASPRCAGHALPAGAPRRGDRRRRRSTGRMPSSSIRRRTGCTRRRRCWSSCSAIAAA